MTMPRVEVITSVERRRRWSRDEKERLVAASFEPGVSVSEIARSAGIHVSQLFRWRKDLCERVEAGPSQLVPGEIVPAANRFSGYSYVCALGMLVRTTSLSPSRR